MPKHFQKPWEKWEYVEEILIDLNVKNTEEFRKALNKMNKKELAILTHQIKEKINKIK
jgi:hypothetical protein